MKPHIVGDWLAFSGEFSEFLILVSHFLGGLTHVRILRVDVVGLLTEPFGVAGRFTSTGHYAFLE